MVTVSQSKCSARDVTASGFGFLDWLEKAKKSLITKFEGLRNAMGAKSLEPLNKRFESNDHPVSSLTLEASSVGLGTKFGGPTIAICKQRKP
jgi:hypothetical protein